MCRRGAGDSGATYSGHGDDFWIPLSFGGGDGGFRLGAGNDLRGPARFPFCLDDPVGDGCGVGLGFPADGPTLLGGGDLKLWGGRLSGIHPREGGC